MRSFEVPSKRGAAFTGSTNREDSGKGSRLRSVTVAYGVDRRFETLPGRPG